MKKNIIKIVAIGILLSVVLASFSACNVPDADTEESQEQTFEKIEITEEDDTEADTEPEEEKKAIDLYIIAGQSNAAGYTRINNTVLAQLWDKYNIGSENVIYAGRAETTANVNTPQVSTVANEIDWQPAKAGFGKTTSHMGAEVGMAKVLSEEYYTGNRTAGIIKLAHGGTSLVGGMGGENAANGNWVSPTFAELRKYDYTGIHGGLYRALLAQVEKNVAELQEMGYEEISIKGLFWMQGESDRGTYESVFDKAITCFISDIRRDLGEITGEDLSTLPIMIGEISRTCDGAKEGMVTLNEQYIEMQRAVAEKVENVYIIPSAQFEIVTLDSSGNEKLDPYQNDKVHWNTTQMFEIGELVGRCIIDNILT